MRNRGHDTIRITFTADLTKAKSVTLREERGGEFELSSHDAPWLFRSDANNINIDIFTSKQLYNRYSKPYVVEGSDSSQKCVCGFK